MPDVTPGMPEWSPDVREMIPDVPDVTPRAPGATPDARELPLHRPDVTLYAKDVASHVRNVISDVPEQVREAQELRRDVRDVFLRVPDELQRAGLFNATASRTSALNAEGFKVSPSRRSIARLTLPSRLELNSFDGSSSSAPLANVTLTMLL